MKKARKFPLPQDGDVLVHEWRTPGWLRSMMFFVGKARAGRILDGRTWEEFPK